MNRQASLRKIIANDYIASVSFLFPIATWGFIALLFFTSRYHKDDIILVVIFSALTVVCLCSLIWRVNLLSRMVTNGLEATAIISQIFFYKDRGQVRYTYVNQGQNMTITNAIAKTKQTKLIMQGQQVIVLVDPANPKRAFIRDLYSRDE
jgi:hypothetical protein